MKSLHTDATLDYKKSDDEQLEIIKSVTGGHFGRIFDTVAQSASCAIKALQQCSTAESKYFSTTDDWYVHNCRRPICTNANIHRTPMDPVDGIKIDRIQLGLIGRSGDLIKQYPTINKTIASYIPKLVAYIEKGELKPNAYEIVGKTGFDSVTEAIKIQNQGKGGGTKYVVHIQNE